MMLPRRMAGDTSPADTPTKPQRGCFAQDVRWAATLCLLMACALAVMEATAPRAKCQCPAAAASSSTGVSGPAGAFGTVPLGSDRGSLVSLKGETGVGGADRDAPSPGGVQVGIPTKAFMVVSPGGRESWRTLQTLDSLKRLGLPSPELIDGVPTGDDAAKFPCFNQSVCGKVATLGLAFHRIYGEIVARNYSSAFIFEGAAQSGTFFYLLVKGGRSAGRG